MTEERLAELERLCAAATPGPWEHRWGTPAGVHQPVYSCWIPQTKEDALLIAAARTAVPELIAEVKRLRAALAPFAELGKRFTDGWPDDTRISDLLANNLTLGDCRRAAL